MTAIRKICTLCSAPNATGRTAPCCRLRSTPANDARKPEIAKVARRVRTLLMP